jgi:hypothetical protein
MSKMTLKLDLNDDYDKALEEFEKIFKLEQKKNKERKKLESFLGNLHKLVNSQLNTNFKNTNSLIQALTPYASPSFKEKLAKSATGRRKTISMNKEIYFSIKDLLKSTSPNKAAIAREVGVSVVQVRKVAAGGYDTKYGTIDSPVGSAIKTTVNPGTANRSEINKAPGSRPLAPTKGDGPMQKPNQQITRPPMRLPAKSPLDL